MTRQVVSLVAVAVLGCAEPPKEKPSRPPVGWVDTGTPRVVESDTDTDTYVTPEPWYDCAEVGQPPFTTVEVAIATEEDFDFDANGYLIHQANGDLVGVDAAANFKLISPQVTSDPAGISVLSTGHIAVASPSTGLINVFDPTTGAGTVAVANLSRVNSMDVGAGDVIYFTESITSGQLSWVDPATLDHGTILQDAPLPNGVAMSPDSTRLYFSNDVSNVGYIYVIDHDGIDWLPPRELMSMAGDHFAALEVDVCGTVWAVGFSHGKILRIPADTEIPEHVGTLTDNAYANAHNGNGIGGWRRDTLYITNRSVITAISVGVPGRQHPSNPIDGPDL